MKSGNRSKRKNERVKIALPVQMAGVAGHTRDVSAGGIFFEMAADARIHSLIEFDMQMETARGRIKIACRGRIVRTESKEQRRGIAVALTDIKMQISDSISCGQQM